MDDIDAYSTVQKQIRMLDLILYFHDRAQRIIKHGAPIAVIHDLPVVNTLIRMKSLVPNDDMPGVGCEPSSRSTNKWINWKRSTNERIHWNRRTGSNRREPDRRPDHGCRGRRQYRLRRGGGGDRLHRATAPRPCSGSGRGYGGGAGLCRDHRPLHRRHPRAFLWASPCTCR